MSLKPYPAYKGSGAAWLGDVPEHWEIKRVRFLCNVTTGERDTVNAVEAGDYPFFVRSQTIERINSYSYDGEAVLTAGDGVGVGKVYHYYDGKFDFHQRVYMMSGFRFVTGRFFYHYLSTMFYKVALEGGAKSTVDSLRMPLFMNFLVTVPSIEEQEIITALIEQETGKIDDLIAEQEKLIALLAEKRQATISHAVTKGLNPAAPMKDSGVEWLGQIPAHWTAQKGGRIGRLFGSEIISENNISDEGDLPFIKVASLSSSGFEIECCNWFVDPAIAQQFTPRVNYIVFPKRGAAIFGNKVNVIEIPSIIDPNLMGWQIGEEAITKYVAYALKVRQISELADVSTVPQINNKHVEPEKFPLPPLSEQHEIVAFLDAKLAKLDALTAEANRVIDLLKERRTALISAAVTGKIDVRGAPPTASRSPLPVNGAGEEAVA